MATIASLMTIVKSMVGNRTDIDAIIEESVRNALRATAALHPSPDNFMVHPFSIAGIAYKYTLPATIEMLSDLSVFIPFDPADAEPGTAGEKGTWREIAKGNPSQFLFYNTTGEAQKWGVFEREVWIWPEPIEDTVITYYRGLARVIRGGEATNTVLAWLDDSLLPSVILFSVAFTKIMLGQEEGSLAMKSWADKLGTRLYNSLAQMNRHGHSGITPYVPEI